MNIDMKVADEILNHHLKETGFNKQFMVANYYCMIADSTETRKSFSFDETKKKFVKQNRTNHTYYFRYITIEKHDSIFGKMDLFFEKNKISFINSWFHDQDVIFLRKLLADYKYNELNNELTVNETNKPTKKLKL
jgi:hypothetical protein